MKKGARIYLVLPDEDLRHKLWQQTQCYVLVVGDYKHKTARDTLYMHGHSVAVRYMYACTVIGEVPNKNTLYWLFVIFMFSMKKTSVAVINVMGHHH